jgi:putative transposase
LTQFSIYALIDFMPRRRRKMVQLSFREPCKWGGKRKGAGRKKVKGVVLHQRRPTIEKRHPVHVTLKLRKEVGSLRTDHRWRRIQRAFRYGCDRFGMRLVEFAVLHDHIHLVVEADDKRALSRGIQGLAIRIARGINRVSQRRGRVFADRYHARPLKTLAEVRNAIHYVRRNDEIHIRRRGGNPHPWYIDPFSSMSGEAMWYVDESWQSSFILAKPQSWLVQRARDELLRPRKR